MRTYIFDLDGTLANTIGIHHTIEMFLLKSQLEREHIKYDAKKVENKVYEIAKQCDNAKLIASKLSETFNLHFNIEQWTNTKNNLVFSAIKSRNIQVYPKLRLIIEKLSKQGNKVLLLTSGEKPLVLNCIKYWKLDKIFTPNKIITTYDKLSVYKTLKNLKDAKRFHGVVVYEDNLKYLNLCKKMEITCYRCEKGQVKLYYDNRHNTLEVLGCEETL